MFNLLHHALPYWHALSLGLAGIVHTVTRTYADESGVGISLTERPSGDGDVNLTDPSLAVTANHQYHVAFTQANMQSLCIMASGAVTVYTNNPSGSTPQDTIVITAGQVFIWTLLGDGIGRCPFSANVTTIYVTNAGSGPVVFQIRAVVNE